MYGIDLGPAQAAQQTARRKELYEILHPETRVGAVNQHTVARRQIGDEQNDRFTADTAERTGRSERVVQRDATDNLSAAFITYKTEWPVRPHRARFGDGPASDKMSFAADTAERVIQQRGARRRPAPHRRHVAQALLYSPMTT